MSNGCSIHSDTDTVCIPPFHVTRFPDPVSLSITTAPPMVVTIAIPLARPARRTGITNASAPTTPSTAAFTSYNVIMQRC